MAKGKKSKAAEAVPFGPDKQWQTEQDARSMMEAAKIMGDPARHEAAKKEMMKMMKGMQKMVGSEMSSKKRAESKKNPYDD